MKDSLDLIADSVLGVVQKLLGRVKVCETLFRHPIDEGYSWRSVSPPMAGSSICVRARGTLLTSEARKDGSFFDTSIVEDKEEGRTVINIVCRYLAAELSGEPCRRV
ncbi:hypothetical protein BaRGS_00031668 [Batillaria attramentaria]|uniref:Uncharacterized protein n=1 Tax=Batillaria attramentaria TaxID=370345 RepID=A0ABD0JQC9_9CAEN